MIVSLLWHYGDICVRGTAYWWAVPAAILADLCKAPFLLAIDIGYNAYSNVLYPLAVGVGNVFKVSLSPEVLAFMAKSLVFVVPCSILVLGGYCAYKLVKGSSIPDDFQRVGACILSGMEKIIAPEKLAIFLAGMAVGAAIAVNASP